MSSFDRIVDLIDAKNTPPVPLTRNNISFDNVIADPEANWNTRVTVSSKATGEYVGSVNIYYTRTNLRELGIPVEFCQEGPFTLQSLCDAINKAKNCQINPEDLTLSKLPPMSNGVIATVTLSANTQSLVWLGNTQARLLTGIPDQADNLHTFMSTTLPGLFASK